MKKRVKCWLFPMIAALLCACLPLLNSAETILDPARDSGQAAAAGYRLDTMRSFRETLPNGSVKIWYLDETNGLKAFWQKMDHDETLANVVAHNLAANGSHAYSEIIQQHPAIDGILVAEVAVSDGLDAFPRSYAGFSFIDDKKAADPLYGRTVVTYQGNCNLDESIDMKDALMLRLRIRDLGSGDSAVCTDPGHECLNEIWFDANDDGFIDMKDVLYLRKFIAGLIAFAPSTTGGYPDPPFAEYRFDIPADATVWGCPVMPPLASPIGMSEIQPAEPTSDESGESQPGESEVASAEPESGEPEVSQPDESQPVDSESDDSEASAEEDVLFPYPYGVFLGVNGKITPFRDYKTVVLDAQYFTDEQIGQLKADGHTVYSYINVGSLENFRDYYDEFKHLALGAYENWDEEVWLDVSDASWQRFILNDLAEALKTKGIDGYFVDNCDVYYEYPTKKIYSGLVTIMEGLVDKGLDVLINSGNDFMEAYTDAGGDWRNVITGINQETVFSAIDFDTETFSTADEEDHLFFMNYVETYGSQGADIYLLEYTTDPDLIAQIAAYCEEKGFCYYASRTIELTG